MFKNILLSSLFLFYFIVILITALKKKEILFKLAFYIGLVIISISFFSNLMLFSGYFMPVCSVAFGFISYLIAVLLINFHINPEAVKCISKYKNYSYCKNKIFKTIFTSTYEEFLWRGSLYYFFNNNIHIIILSSVFSFLHIGKKITVWNYTELFLFSMIEYFVLMETQNILNCIMIHAIRNIFIILLDFNITQENVRSDYDETRV